MAGRESEDRDRRSNRSRRPAPVIDGTAKDVSPPAEMPVAQDTVGTGTVSRVVAAEPSRTQATTTPEAVEPPLEPVTPEPSPLPEEAKTAPEPAKLEEPDIIAPPLLPPVTKPRPALPLAAAGLVGALFGAGAGAVMPGLMSSPLPVVEAARLQRLEQGLADLARRPTPPPQPAATQPLPQDVQDLPRRIAALEAQIAARLTQMDQRIAALPVSPGAASVDLTPLTDKVGVLEKALAALDQKAEAARTAAGESIRTVAPQIQQLTARLTETAQRVEVTAAAPLFTAAQAVSQAFQRGVPFTAELAALEALGVKPGQIAALKDLAAKGAPTVRQLSESFRPLAEQMTRAAAPAATGLEAVWQSFVTSRPAGTGAGAPQPGLPGAVESALRAGDVSAALTAWAQLPEAARKTSEAWAATARQREAAQMAIRDLNEAALAALRKAAP